MARGLRDLETPSAGGKAFSQKRAGINHLNDETGWHFLKWHCVVDAANTFFDCKDVPFDFEHVLIGGHGVQVDLDVSKVGSESFTS